MPLLLSHEGHFGSHTLGVPEAGDILEEGGRKDFRDHRERGEAYAQLVSLEIWGDQTLDSYILLFCYLALIVARRDILKHWGMPTLPTMRKWEKGLDWCMGVEK
ncbi:hypothetical protein NDU88_003658 [Pleurodeles waltl]|uniref:Uncharacterized protein n=1 Tax=Pleurodeles waltl TaxID=8319 RepID=A0AAV7SGK2_PLEWA|nr:hypothetical protein NDU88_003658 [Pleurodeles waltl]